MKQKIVNFLGNTDMKQKKESSGTKIISFSNTV